ncbi:MAG: hypothetical protein CMF41_03340 [Legionellales bacterium]|nr:hypothetical protein [Legionellales bacterium]
MNGSDTIKTNNPRLDAFEWLFQIFVKQHTNLMDRSLVGTDPKVRQALEVYLAYTVVREISYLYPEHRRAIMEKLDQSLKDVTKQYESNAFIKEIFTKKTGKNVEPIFELKNKLTELIQKDGEFIRDYILEPEISMSQNISSSMGFFTKLSILVGVGVGLYFGLGVLLPIIGLVVQKEMLLGVALPIGVLVGCYFASQSLEKFWRSMVCSIYYGSSIGSKERQHISHLNPKQIEKKQMLQGMYSAIMGQGDDFASIGIKEHWVDLLQWCIHMRNHKPESIKKQPKESYLFKEKQRSNFSFFGSSSKQRYLDETSSTGSDSLYEVSLDSPRSDESNSETNFNHGRYGGRF